jgi:hypothetical protein
LGFLLIIPCYSFANEAYPDKISCIVDKYAATFPKIMTITQMTKKLALLLLALCLLCSCTDSKSQATAQTKRQDIIKLFGLMNLDESNILELIKYTLQADWQDYRIPDEFFEYANEKIKTKNFLEMYIDMYDKNLSQNEIKELIEFFESPLGKKLLKMDGEPTEKIISQTKMQNIMKLLDLTGVKANISASIDSLSEYMQKNKHDMPSKYYELLEFKLIRKKADLEKTIELNIMMYDETFSDEDIKELIKFYESPLGKKQLQIIEASLIIEEFKNEMRSLMGEFMEQTRNKDGEAIYDIFTDARDGKTYATKKVGGQTWMARNLNYVTEGSKCYDNEPVNCQMRGRLYNWSEAAKVCPEGWHLPANAQWNKLGDNYIEMDELVDLFGGSFSYTGFDFIGFYGFYWSATESEQEGNAHYIASTTFDRASLLSGSKTSLFSVRCVK